MDSSAAVVPRSAKHGLWLCPASRAGAAVAIVTSVTLRTAPIGTRRRPYGVQTTEPGEDPEVQDALEGLAWETTCALVFDEVPATVEEVAIFLVERAVNFGISFLEEGEREMADLVLDAFEEQENEAQDACNEIRQ